MKKPFQFRDFFINLSISYEKYKTIGERYFFMQCLKHFDTLPSESQKKFISIYFQNIITFFDIQNLNPQSNLKIVIHNHIIQYGQFKLNKNHEFTVSEIEQCNAIKNDASLIYKHRTISRKEGQNLTNILKKKPLHFFKKSNTTSKLTFLIS